MSRVSRRKPSTGAWSGSVVAVTPEVATPTVQHRHAATDVAQRDRQVDHGVGHLDDAVPTFDPHPVIVGEPDLLRRVLDP